MSGVYRDVRGVYRDDQEYTEMIRNTKMIRKGGGGYADKIRSIQR